jgi:hypothetical protein
MIENGDSSALKEALCRLEGYVPRETVRELPAIEVKVQTVNVSQPVTHPGQPMPSLPAQAMQVQVSVPRALDEDDDEHD